MSRRVPGDWEEDEWHERDFHRTSGSYNHVQPYGRSSGGNLLNPDVGHSSSRYRSRSIGASPAPNVYVYTSQRNDVDNRSPSPDPRGRREARTTEILDKLDVIDHDIRRASSRSRGPDYRDSSPYYREMQLELQREREDRIRQEEVLARRLGDLDRTRGAEKYRDHELLKEAEMRMRRLEDERHREADKRERAERDEELYKKKAELRRLKDRIEREEADARLEERDKSWKAKLEMERLKEEEKRQRADLKAKEERARILAQRDEDERKAKVERNRIKDEIERKEKEEEDERKLLFERYQSKEAKKKTEAEEANRKAVAEYEKKKADEKRKKEELKAEFKREEEEKKAKDKDEEEKWKAKLAAKEKEAKDKKKAEDQKIEDAMHKKLAVYGFQENQIEAVLKPKKAAHLPLGATPLRPRPALDWRAEAPTYVKVHRTYIEVETLNYFGLPWEYDSVSFDQPIVLPKVLTLQ